MYILALYRPQCIEVNQLQWPSHKKKYHPRSVGSLTGSFELNEVDDLTGIKIIGTFYAHFSTGSFG